MNGHNEYRDDLVLFPLSPEIHNKNSQNTTNVGVYNRYLSAAYNEKRIRNIAITGRFGIGKSSIIRTFDALRNGGGINLHFLYVSLGRYGNYQRESNAEIRKNGSQQAELVGAEGGATNPNDAYHENEVSAENKEDNNSLNIIERRILLQIFSRFNQRDIPLSNFQFIQEKAGKEEEKLSSFFSVLLLDILLLINFGTIEQLLAGIKFFAEKAVGFHILLYAILFAQVIFCFKRFFPWMAERMQVKVVSFKSDHGEIEIDRKACEGYLDIYTTDIVYCLESVADQIDRTVVFEDMDRLGSGECLYLFMRLREINNLVNARIGNKEPIRFIYVVNDSMVGDIIHTKFFDYIMPVIPILNPKTSRAMFTKNWELINKSIVPYYSAKIQLIGEEKEFFDTICQYICDYRLQYAILNEYALLLSIYYTNNEDDPAEESSLELYKRIRMEILALSVYKNTYPKDYYRLYKGESVVFPERRELMKEEENPELLECLARRLSISSLYYLGYGETQYIAALRAMWEKMSDISLANEVRTFNYKESKEMTHALLSVISDRLRKYNYDDSAWKTWDYIESDNKIKRRIDVDAIRLWGEVIHSFSDNNVDIKWFFENLSMENCLYIVSQATLLSIPMEFERVDSGGRIVYDSCKGIELRRAQHKLLNKDRKVILNEAMLEEFCRAYRNIEDIDSEVLTVELKDDMGNDAGACRLCENDPKIIEIRNRI